MLGMRRVRPHRITYYEEKTGSSLLARINLLAGEVTQIASGMHGSERLIEFLKLVDSIFPDGILC